MKRVALYLQDAHDLRDGLDYVRYAEQRGFEAVCRLNHAWCGMRSCLWLPTRQFPSGSRLVRA